MTEILYLMIILFNLFSYQHKPIKSDLKIAEKWLNTRFSEICAHMSISCIIHARIIRGFSAE